MRSIAASWCEFHTATEAAQWRADVGPIATICPARYTASGESRSRAMTEELAYACEAAKLLCCLPPTPAATSSRKV